MSEAMSHSQLPEVREALTVAQQLRRALEGLRRLLLRGHVLHEAEEVDLAAARVAPLAEVDETDVEAAVLVMKAILEGDPVAAGGVHVLQQSAAARRGLRRSPRPMPVRLTSSIISAGESQPKVVAQAGFT